MGQQGQVIQLQSSAEGSNRGMAENRARNKEHVGWLNDDYNGRSTSGHSKDPEVNSSAIGPSITPTKTSTKRAGEKSGIGVNIQPTHEVACWERERETNVQAYALMKADILALREEVASFYEDRERIDIKETRPGSTCNPTLTVVDLKEHLSRPGLGPESLDLLDLEKEDIGFKHPVTILDYPSPPDRYSFIQLSDQGYIVLV